MTNGTLHLSTLSDKKKMVALHLGTLSDKIFCDENRHHPHLPHDTPALLARLATLSQNALHPQVPRDIPSPLAVDTQRKTPAWGRASR